MTDKRTPGALEVTDHFYVTDVHGVLSGDELVCGDIGNAYDARLIAAAPDLMEALRFYANLPAGWTINAGGGLTYGSLHLLGEKARAAIAKVEGNDMSTTE